jgi:ATP:ADP antiporter, AAA family
MHQIAVERGKPAVLDKVFSLFANVRPGEGATALLLMANIFTLLTAYYIIKPVREALILAEAGAEIKSYASAGQAALFLLIVPLYGKFGSSVNRVWLINGVTAFFMSNLALFFVLGRLGISLGIVFYLWVGMFNVMLVAQFWAFANDVYTQKEGERLFGIVGIGASLGAIFGSLLAGWTLKPLGVYAMMLISAGLLGICMVLTSWVHFREKQRVAAARTSKAETVEKPLGTAGGFKLILGNRYLLLIGLLVLLSNCVNTTGEFILGKTVQAHAVTLAPGSGEEAVAAQKNLIGQFYTDFNFWVSLIGALLQMFVVSRITQHWGAGTALFFLPIIALGGYTVLALIPILSLIRVAKILENSVDYSVQNTARHALFLPTSREAKYKAKAAIDSFFWRSGDTLSGLLVFTGTQLAMSIRLFSAVNVVLVLVWLGIAFAIRRCMTDSPAATTIAA